jgi:hypothetical protein
MVLVVSPFCALVDGNGDSAFSLSVNCDHTNVTLKGSSCMWSVWCRVKLSGGRWKSLEQTPVLRTSQRRFDGKSENE